MEQFDVLIIGAGPTGLACAIEAQCAGYSVVAVDKGCVVNSLYNYPTNMTFFTTPELLEIGGIPFVSAQPKPSRPEALEYYRKVAEFYRLDVRQYHNVTRTEGADGAFLVHCLDRLGRPAEFLARKLVVATGYYDLPNRLGCPGEELAKVTHYYREPHPYNNSDVVVVEQKLGRHRRPRAMASRSPCHAGSSRAGAVAQRQVLDQARPGKPNQEPGDRRLLQQLASRDHPGSVEIETPTGRLRLEMILCWP